MKATIEHSFCPYCDEVTELYFRIINTQNFDDTGRQERDNLPFLPRRIPFFTSISLFWLRHILL